MIKFAEAEQIRSEEELIIYIGDVMGQDFPKFTIAGGCDLV